jgi:hypothetical protein
MPFHLRVSQWLSQRPLGMKNEKPRPSEKLKSRTGSPVFRRGLRDSKAAKKETPKNTRRTRRPVAFPCPSRALGVRRWRQVVECDGCPEIFPSVHRAHSKLRHPAAQSGERVAHLMTRKSIGMPMDGSVSFPSGHRPQTAIVVSGQERAFGISGSAFGIKPRGAFGQKDPKPRPLTHSRHSSS